VYQEELALARRLGSDELIAEAQFDLAFTRRLLDDVEGSDRAMAEARERFARVGDEFAVLRLDWASTLIFTEGMAPETRARYVRSIAERLEARGDPWSTGSALHLRSQLLLYEGRPVEALRMSLEAFRMALAVRDQAEVVLALQPLAAELLRIGRADLAVVVIGAIEGAGERFGIRAPVSFERVSGIPDPERELIDQLGVDPYTRTIEMGRRMTLEEAIDLVADGLRSPDAHAALASAEPAAS
jgi:hypothetical protein